MRAGGVAAQRGELPGAPVPHGGAGDAEVHPLRGGDPLLGLVPAPEAQQVVDGVDVHEAAERRAHAEPLGVALAGVHRRQRLGVLAAQPQDLAQMQVGARARLARRRRLQRAAQLRLPAGAVAQEREHEAERGPGLGLRLRRAGLRRGGERGLAAAAGLLQPPQPHQRVALGGQQPRTLRAGVAGQQRQRSAVVLQRALVVPEVMLAEPLVEQRRPDGLARRVDLAERRRARAPPHAARSPVKRAAWAARDSSSALSTGAAPPAASHSSSERSRCVRASVNAYARAASSPAVTDAASAASWAPARYHWTASCEAAAPGRSASACAIARCRRLRSGGSSSP